MRKDWKKLFSLEKIKRHNNGLQVVFVERTVLNYSLGTLTIKESNYTEGKCSSDLKRGVSNHEDGEVLMYTAWGGCRIAICSVLKNRLVKHFQESFWHN